jgi:hypothetical protein
VREERSERGERRERREKFRLVPLIRGAISQVRIENCADLRNAGTGGKCATEPKR